MCHAILRIAYHHDKAREVVEVEKEEDFDRRLSEIRDRPGVRKVTIFKPHMSFEEVKKWQVTDHKTGEVKDEKVNEVSVDAKQSFEISQEIPTPTGQRLPPYEEVCEGVESSYGEDCASSKGIDPV